MTRSPEHIQQQLSDAITVIGQCDFPDQWPNLLDTMVRQFQQPSTQNSFQSINGVLKTAHLLFERYRYEQKSDELWLEIKLVLEKFAPAFTELFKVDRFLVSSDFKSSCFLVIDGLLSAKRIGFSRNEEHIRFVVRLREDFL